MVTKMAWAHIQNGRVEEVTDTNPEGRFHPSLIWKECGKDIIPGDIYRDGAFYRAPDEFSLWNGNEYSTDQDKRKTELSQRYCKQLDQFADQVRLRFLPGGNSDLAEYMRTEELAIEHKKGGYKGEPPRPIAAHMRRYNVNAEAAIKDILARATTMNEVLDTVRDHRFDGKTALERLGKETTEDQFQAEFKKWYDKLDLLKPTD